MTQPGLEPWMAEYRGLAIGSPDSPITFTAISGLLDAPDVRTADRTTLGRHGDATGRDYLSARTVTLTMDLNATSDSEFAETLDRLTAAFMPTVDAAPFTFQFPGIAGGGIRYVMAKVRRRAIAVDPAYAQRYSTVTVELYCPSPVIQDPLVQRVTIPLPRPEAASGGIKLPIRTPIRFGPASQLGVITAVNDGTFVAFPRFRVFGPVDTPEIVDLGTGQRLTLRTVLPRDAWLDIDTYTHEVHLNGIAPRWVTSGTGQTWLTCPPGVTRFAYRGFRLDPGPTGDGASLTCEWQSTWV